MKVSQRLVGMIALPILLAATGRGDEEVVKVAELGNPTNWQVSGVESFDPLDVKRSLSRDFDVLLAAHAQAPRSALAAVLRERLLEGYRHLGFAAAVATVDLDEPRGQVIIQVTEGRRYQCGRVRVEGVDDALAERLRLALTTEQLPDSAVTPVFDDRGEPMHWLDQNGKKVDFDKPLWVEEKPAAFNDSVRGSVTRRLTRSLGQLGYAEPKFTHELTRAETTADLLVRVEDLGSPAVLREIDIVGNEKNSRDEIIDYLKLRIGEAFASAEKRRVLFALRESARFIEQQAETERIDASGGIKLTIQLQELSVAPRLSEPLSREDLALLKLHDWLARGAGWGLDSVVRMKTESLKFDCVISSSGAVASVRIQPEQATATPVSHAFIASAQRIELYNLRDKRCLIVPTGTAGLKLTTGFEISGNQERPFRYNFSLSLSSVEGGQSKPPIELKTTMEPAYFLGLARLQNPVYLWDGDRLSIRTDRNELTVDSRTGRLLERSLTTEATGPQEFEYRAGAFDEAVSQLRAMTAGFRNEYDTNRPVSSTLKYGGSLVEIFAALKPEIKLLARLAEPNSVAAAGKLLDLGLLNDIDQAWISEKEADDADDFSIPPSQPLLLSHASAGRVAAMFAEDIFPRDSWPSTVLRESGFFLAGYRDYTGSELSRVMNSGTLGPIGHWLLAELMNQVSPPIAASIAQRGGEHLSREAFERDVLLLTANCKQQLNAPIRATCGLSDEEVASLGRLVLSNPDQLVDAIQLLRESKRDDTNAAILRALGQLWTNDLQRRVGERLRVICMHRLPRVTMNTPQ